MIHLLQKKRLRRPGEGKRDSNPTNAPPASRTKIAVTGATEFLGRYVVNRLAQRHELRCWHRPTSDRSGFEHLAGRLEWLVGELGSCTIASTLPGGRRSPRGCSPSRW